MLSPAQKNLSEEDGSGSDAGSEVSLEPETDRFGFILTNGSTGSVGPPPELVRQRETKWINIILQWDRMLLKKTSKVKVQCQKGIPASLRAKCWPLLCAATNKMKQNEKLYESLDSRPALQSWVDVIERDLGRQFPFHEMFLCKDGHGQRGLFRVLKAYTQYQPEEGYCQAQGPVAAVLLMNMPAEEAFWCLVQISEYYLPGYYSPLLEGVVFDAGMLTWVLSRTCPAAHKHLQHHGVEPLMFATDWLMCLFTRHLPFNTLLRVWDLFFCYGVRVLLQVTVVLVRRVLGRGEQRKQCQGQMETLERLRGVREQVHEEDDTFIAEVCSVPLSAKDLEKQTERELEKWRKDRPSSTFDPRGRCEGYSMAWAKARQNIADRERTEREKWNLSVPLCRSASTLSLSSTHLQKRLRKGGHVKAVEGGGKVARHLSMGAKEDWRSWTELHFKKVQGVEEEEDADEHKKLRGKTEEKELSEEHKEEDNVQSVTTVNAEEVGTKKEQNEQAETVTSEEENHPVETTDEREREEANQETMQNQGPATDQTVESILQPTQRTFHHEQGEELGSYSQSQVLEQPSHKDQGHETERQVSECERSAAIEKNRSEIQKNNVADTYTDKEIEVYAESDEEQIVRADMKVEEGTENTNEDTVTKVSETRNETDGNVTDPNPTLETETQEGSANATEKTSQGDTFQVEHISTESLTGREANVQTETETEEKLEESAATQDESHETEVVQADGEIEADTLIPSLRECIQQQEADVAADTGSEAEIPVADATVTELRGVFAHCPEKQCEGEAEEVSELVLGRGELILTVHSETPGDHDETRAEETPIEPRILAETAAPAAPPPKEATSQEAETLNLFTKHLGEMSSDEISSSEKPEPQEPTCQALTSPLEEKDNAQDDVAREEDVFISTPNVAGNPHTDPTNPQGQIKMDNVSLTQASGHFSSRSSGDFCVRKSPCSRETRLARRLSEDLFTAPQKASQPQSTQKQAEVKHTGSKTNHEAMKRTQTSRDATQSSQVAEQEAPAASKRFGLFRRLRGEQPKKANGKKVPKMQVPKILIQDFSDGTGTGRLVEESEEKLSSRQRRRRRREQERREKEEERLRKKKEKEMEKEKERERREPQTMAKVKKEKGGKEPPKKTKSGSQRLQYSASYF